MPNSPYGGTTSLPQYLQQRQQKPPASSPTVTPPPGGFNPAQASSAGAPSQSPTDPRNPQGGIPGQAAAPPPAPAGPLPMNPNSPMAPPPPGAMGVPPTGLRNPQGGVPTGQPAAPPAAPAPATPPAAAPTPNVDPGAVPPSTPATTPPAAVPPASPPPFDFLGYLREQLNGGGRYSSDLINGMRTNGQQQLQDFQRTQTDSLESELAKRGMLGSSQLTTGLGDLSERVSRMAGQQENDLQKTIADAGATDRQNNVQNILNYGQGENQSRLTDAQIMNMIFGNGAQGGPTIPGAVGDYGTLPSPTPTDNSSIYEWIARMYGPRTPAAQPAAA